MKHLVLMPVALALFARELARAMVRAYQFEDDDFFDEDQQMRPPGSVRHVGGGWRA